MKNIYNTYDVINKSGINFGTSGARGLVTDFTPEVCAAFTISFLTVMQQRFSSQRLRSQLIIVQAVTRWLKLVLLLCKKKELKPFTMA